MTEAAPGDDGEPVGDYAAPRGLDALAADLRELRHHAGNPSYAEIALRIDRVRGERGIPAGSARPGRTTVYDAFRSGRRRLDVNLLRDIVRALGGTEDDVEAWTQRHHDLSVEPAPVREPAPEEPEPGEGVPEPAPEAEAAPAAAKGDEPPAPRPRLPLPVRRLVAVLVGCVVLNLLGRLLVDTLHLPLYLDMMGTAVSALALGPWWGALVGVSTNVLGEAGSPPGVSSAFTLVNVAGALVWGYGARRFGMARTMPRFFVLNLVAALVCTFVATPTLLVVYGGSVGHSGDELTERVRLGLHSLPAAVLVMNLLTSVLDKLVSGFIGLTTADAIAGPEWRGDDPSRPPDGSSPDVVRSPRVGERILPPEVTGSA
ncbi:MAG: ECF transporter S component [Kytococcus sp.]|uniref:ECF transporter S component n=1 Tax=Janibacter terrae TaxID=103817 RepID=UPI00083920C5|nr:ECF transporter S component [Janibacter terrae]MBA4085044.1 ECF transporter S component [Kytococcus sp.]